MKQRIQKIDPAIAADRRRFFIERALRIKTLGTGSDLDRLMGLPRSDKGKMASAFFGDIPIMLIGAHAANAFMPPSHTDDVDVIAAHDRFDEAEKLLERTGWTKLRDLFFPNAKLGLYGSAWSHSDFAEEVDVLSSARPWLAGAFAWEATYDQNDARVLPLPFLALMKLDSARTTDQGDLGRMLGRLEAQHVESIVRVVETYYEDHQAAEDVRQYAAIGRWEYEQSDRRSNVQEPDDRES